MAVLSDIVAKLSLDLDKASFTKANRTLKGLADTAAEIAVETAPAIAVLAGVGFALLKVTEAASDANETLNVLNASFEDQSQVVQDWAATFAGEAGRSEFELREMAATMGAVLNPMMDRNAEAAAGMSTGLAQLAVDLGSFFNSTDTDALDALRAGILGEAEPLKRFGIVMLESTLAAFALSQGITKSVKSMTIAEKTALRYEFILDQTRLAQGDAAATSEGWANATKGLMAALKDLGTNIGFAVLPFAERLVIMSRNATRAFSNWIKSTDLIKAGLIVLGAIAAKVALGVLIAWGPVLIPILKFAAFVAVAALVLEDFLVFMDGGDSVIGHFIDKIFGPGSATEAVENLNKAWEGMKLFWDNEVIPSLRVLKAFGVEVAEELGKAWDEWFENFGIWVLENEAHLLSFTEKAKDLLKFLARITGFQSFIDLVGLSGPQGGVERTAGRGMGASIADPNSTSTGTRGTGVSAAKVQNITNTTNVTVQGNATAADAGRIADASSEGQRRNDRRTRAALVQRGAD